MMNEFQGTYENVNFLLKKAFVQDGRHVRRGEWQALTDDRPQMSVVELHDISIYMQVPHDVSEWMEATRPNLPWAENHFRERIAGYPTNPGATYIDWPWYEGGVEEHKASGKFSHTYMERYWPKHVDPADMPMHGIHYLYGDLNDLITLLAHRPLTRQAYLPIWFPEDITAANQQERVPCSLGYLFQVQANALVCYYYMRSCDFIRYLWDDLYLTGRLLQHVAAAAGFGGEPLHLAAKIANLHIFEPELQRVEEEFNQEQRERLSRALG